MATGIGFMIVAMINIIAQSAWQVEMGIVTPMNTIFRAIGGVVGPAIAGVYLALNVLSLLIQTPHGPIVDYFVSMKRRLITYSPTAFAIPLFSVSMALFKGKERRLKCKNLLKKAAAV